MGRVRDLIDMIYVRLELLEGMIAASYRGEERGLHPIMDMFNQVYELLSELKKESDIECKCEEKLI
ncbi:MAG: hypothetical protein P3X22_003475 [Thermoprotei archaeon]|nr:hypothetical protein [Thermoprotei archaeon]